jgi:hypothetical protein
MLLSVDEFKLKVRFFWEKLFFGESWGFKIYDVYSRGKKAAKDLVLKKNTYHGAFYVVC